MPQQPVSANGIADMVAAYLASCRARGLSAKTVERAYALPLERDFLPWCGEVGIHIVGDIEQGNLDAFSRQLLERGRSGRKLSPYSVAAYLRPVNQFLRWAKGQGAEVSGRAQLPRRRKKEIEPLSREDVKTIEDACPAERDKLIVRLMFETGAREGEVAHLRTGDLIARERRYFLRVEGKTGLRHPAITAALYGRLSAYRQHGRGRGCSDDALFTSLNRRPDGRRLGLTETGIYQLVKEAAARAGLSKRVYPHLFRHSAITDMIQRGVSAFVIADNCGVSLQVIQDVYSHLGLDARWDAVTAT